MVNTDHRARSSALEYDDIIVGGGTSGSVIAARLSEDPARKVLLIEAGPDYPSISDTPCSILNANQLVSDHDWGFEAEMTPGRSIAYARGKVIGGSSSVNACIALRGTPDDYDEWRAFGGPKWDRSNMLPVFRRVEADELGPSVVHGANGPVPIRRIPEDALTPTQSEFVAACIELGFPLCPDSNHPKLNGVGSGPWNHRWLGERFVRSSTAIDYLLMARNRPNLEIRSKLLVDQVLLDGSRATGILACSDVGCEKISGRNVILCAGAICTPAILLRSGIGPSDELLALGMTPRVNLAGVGRNLIDHAQVPLYCETKPGVVQEDSPFLQVILRFTSQGSAFENDMQIVPFQCLPQPSLEFGVMLMKPLSRGSITLRSKDPAEQPDIRLNLASEEEDRRRLVEGVRVLGRLLDTPQLRTICEDAVHSADGSVTSRAELSAKLADDDWIDDYVRGTVRHYVHVVGSARMGSKGDPNAVVDAHGAVHRTSSLYVADASIIPTIPSANTNLTCIAIAERIADWMLRK